MVSFIFISWEVEFGPLFDCKGKINYWWLSISLMYLDLDWSNQKKQTNIFQFGPADWAIINNCIVKKFRVRFFKYYIKL